ncbi:unnamed protein product [Rotaria sp. Silwood2]|nr:unnamed protein product [Rotaria sp. Silwood2]CAF4291951.1 unnamed protein product [Rotaria sp. Silwood2]CAF4400894.1 unnamed protein product [Rotaria sp. Silwood2]CAF4609984.1 unnamed protein product [Rotaria sp. Silwood2]
MINASIVSSLLSEKFSQSEVSTKVNLRAPSIREQEIANHLAKLLKSIINSYTFTVDNETTLDYISNELSEDDVDQYVASDDSELDPDFNDTGDDEGSDEKDPLTGKRRRSWKDVKRQSKCVTNSSYIARFRAYIEKSGTKTQKLENINNYVYHKFEQAQNLIFLCIILTCVAGS